MSSTKDVAELVADEGGGCILRIRIAEEVFLRLEGVSDQYRSPGIQSQDLAATRLLVQQETLQWKTGNVNTRNKQRQRKRSNHDGYKAHGGQTPRNKPLQCEGAKGTEGLQLEGEQSHPKPGRKGAEITFREPQQQNSNDGLNENSAT